MPRNNNAPAPESATDEIGVALNLMREQRMPPATTSSRSP